MNVSGLRSVGGYYDIGFRFGESTSRQYTALLAPESIQYVIYSTASGTTYWKEEPHRRGTTDIEP